MLSGDYLTYSIKAKQSGGSPRCRLCPSELDEAEDINHIMHWCNNAGIDRFRCPHDVTEKLGELSDF